jgi:hypothetical protein
VPPSRTRGRDIPAKDEVRQEDPCARDALLMDSELLPADCFVCAKHALGDAVMGGVLFEDELVYAGHAYPLAGPAVTYPGYLVAEPKRHVAKLGDLTDPEAAALGVLVNRLGPSTEVGGRSRARLQLCIRRRACPPSRRLGAPVCGHPAGVLGGPAPRVARRTPSWRG